MAWISFWSLESCLFYESLTNQCAPLQMMPAAPSSSSSHLPRSAPSPVDHHIMRIHDFNIKTEEGSKEYDSASGVSAWQPHFLVRKDSADDTESDISQ
jgi:hypothetical protein